VGVGEKASLVTTVTTALTPALGATSAGIVGLTVAAAPFVIAIGAIGLALKALSDQAATEAGKINAIVDAQRSVGQDIAKGLTSEEANAKLKELQALRDDEAARIAKLNQEYQGNIESQGALSGVLKVFSGAEDALAGQLDKGKGLVTDYETQIAALTKAMDEGATAANDAVVAEKKRKDEQEKAAKEAEQKEKQRLAEVERIQTQIVDASRKYGEKQQDNARQAGQKIQDIETSAQDKRRDLQVQYQDNLSKLGTKNARDAADAQRKIAQTELDAQLKNRQAEVDSVRNQQRTLEDIRKEGLRDEQDALRDRNFLAAAETSDATKDAVDDANKDAQREAEDRMIQQQREAEQRQVGYAREAQDRAINAQRARADLALSNMQAQRDAKIATDRQFRDAAIAQSRQEEATRLAYDRELQQLSEHLNQKLVLESQEQAAERSLKLGASAEQVLRMGSGATSGGGATSVNDSRSLTINLQGGGAQLIEDAKRAVLQTMQKVSYR
jgi:hypothetical protein